MSDLGNLVIVVVAGLVLLGVVLIIREVVCWYWKINRIVDLLESIDRRLADSLAPKAVAEAAQPSAETGVKSDVTHAGPDPNGQNDLRYDA